MQKINKKLLDALMQETKKYWEPSGTKESLEKQVEVCKRISEECNIDWIQILNLVDAIVAPLGFAPNAQDTVIYDVLQALGWEVV